jgi:formylglycine-generating enzyme required for sulfatase activity
MGSDDAQDYNADPPHTVTLSGFYMGKYTVTQAQYTAIIGSNPSYFTTAKGEPPDSGETDGKRPVEQRSWYDAIEFCNKLSEAEGLSPYYTIDKTQQDPNNTNSIDSLKWTITLNNTAKGYRLPTEAEWEYACRAGTTTGWYTGDTEDDKLQAAAWCSDNANSKTHEVGKKTANAWGLYDMHGNVWEWCWGFYGNYKSEAQTDPTGPSSGAYGILRGGAYNQSAQICRSAIRLYAYYPQDGGDSFGFRLARP